MNKLMPSLGWSSPESTHGVMSLHRRVRSPVPGSALYVRAGPVVSLAVAWNRGRPAALRTHIFRLRQRVPG